MSDVRLWVMERGTGFTPRWLKMTSFINAADYRGLDAKKQLFCIDEFRNKSGNYYAEPPTLVNAKVALRFLQTAESRKMERALYIGEDFILIKGTNPYAVLPFLAKISGRRSVNTFINTVQAEMNRPEYAYVRNYQVRLT